MSLLFKLERRVRLPGQDWGEYRLEAECRHFADMRAIAALRHERWYAGVSPVDETGRAVQAEYRITSNASGETLKTFIVGV